MKKNILLIVLFIAFLAMIATYIYSRENNQKNPGSEIGPLSTTTKEFTLAQVAQHAQADNCWFIIDNKVYDVTKYIADKKHPGGAAILSGCGKDATELFNTRPMGSGTPHSDKARSFLPNFYVGDLSK